MAESIILYTGNVLPKMLSYICGDVPRDHIPLPEGPAHRV
jgi:hypothetical protein